MEGQTAQERSRSFFTGPSPRKRRGSLAARLQPQSEPGVDVVSEIRSALEDALPATEKGMAEVQETADAQESARTQEGGQAPAPLGAPRTIPLLARYGWLAVLLWLGAVWVFLYFVLPGALPAGVYMYLAWPLLWGSLAALAFAGWRYGLEERPAFSRRLVVMAGLIGACQVALFVIASLFAGFGHSPYSHQFLPLLGNLLFVGTMLAGLEMSRAYLGAVLGRRRGLLALVLLTLLFSLLMIPAGKFGRLADARSALELGGRTLLPTLSENLLASFLALVGGPLPALAYRGVLEAFHWLSPILPDLEWIVTAFLGTLIPVLGLLYLYNQFAAEPEPEVAGEEATRKGASMTAWLLVAVVAVAALWFNTGLFGVRPTLVSGPSMTPTLKPGDVVITRDVPAEEVQAGDIIRFQEFGVYVIHRVLEVQDEGGRITFITQGDYNNTPDPPVSEQQLAGKVVLTLPKIGWVAIAVRKAVGLIR